jgi:hypothetical protein
MKYEDFCNLREMHARERAYNRATDARYTSYVMAATVSACVTVISIIVLFTWW